MPRPNPMHEDERDGLSVFTSVAFVDGRCEPTCDALVGLGGFRAARDGDVFEVRANHPHEKPVTLVHDKATYVPYSVCSTTCSRFQTDHRSDPPWPLR